MRVRMLTESNAPRVRMATFTLSECRKLLKIARQTGLREYAMISLLLHWGLRATELVSLRVTDLHLRAGYKPTLQVVRLKKKQRIVSVLELQPTVANRLKRYLRERDRDSEYLFPISRVQLYRVFRQLAVRAEITLGLAHPHTCRHTLATSMIADNLSLPIVQAALRHASITSTMKYITVTDQQASQAVSQTVSRLF